jgi:hypothetical protein
MSHVHLQQYPSPPRRSSDPEREARVSGYSAYTQVRVLRQRVRRHPANIDPLQNQTASHYESRPQSSSSSISYAATGLVAPSNSGQNAYYPGHSYYSAPAVTADNYMQYAQGVAAGHVYPVTHSPEDTSPPTSSGMVAAHPHEVSYYPSHASHTPVSGNEDELQALRKRNRELEHLNHHARSRIRQLEQMNATMGTSSAVAGLPSGLPAQLSAPQSPNISPSFEASWRVRTEARVRQFCALNRAGNALCAWHETRRERRAYPPRAAPDGVLNCGCTYDQALFEESLARNGVGAYLPGDSVRMDPALRNPLLRLLQDRYGYRDGDFERDAVTGAWKENEGPLFWEQRSLLGVATRRARGDTQ